MIGGVFQLFVGDFINCSQHLARFAKGLLYAILSLKATAGGGVEAELAAAGDIRS